MNKDWVGNRKSVYTTLGASNHVDSEREDHDYYATEPKAIELLLEMESFSPKIWECACGEGHLSKVLVEKGYEVVSSDLVDRGYGRGGVDFLQCHRMFDGDIITNPPYKYAQEFVEHALSLVPVGRMVVMFLKLQFLEGKARKEMFSKYPPKRIWVSSSRLRCGKKKTEYLGQPPWHTLGSFGKRDTTVKPQSVGLTNLRWIL